MKSFRGRRKFILILIIVLFFSLQLLSSHQASAETKSIKLDPNCRNGYLGCENDDDEEEIIFPIVNVKSMVRENYENEKEFYPLISKEKALNILKEVDKALGYDKPLRGEHSDKDIYDETWNIKNLDNGLYIMFRILENYWIGPEGDMFSGDDNYVSKIVRFGLKYEQNEEGRIGALEVLFYQSAETRPYPAEEIPRFIRSNINKYATGRNYGYESGDPTSTYKNVCAVLIGNYILYLEENGSNSMHRLKTFVKIFKKHMRGYKETDCNNRQVIINGKCVDISKFCGHDDRIEYDTETKKCFCPSGYIKKKEKGKLICIEQGGVILDIKFVRSASQPPLIADGETGTVIFVKGTLRETGKPVSLRFTRHNTFHKNDVVREGKIVNVRENGTGYLVSYRAPELTEIDGQPTEYLFIHYMKKDKEVYESFPIKLYTPRKASARIKRPYFEEVKNYPLLFEGPKTKLYVYITDNRQKVPVVGANVVYEKDYVSTTDTKGIAILKTRQKVYGNKVLKIDAEIKLNKRLQHLRSKAFQYLHEMDYENIEIDQFLRHFVRYIAMETDESDSKQLVAGLTASAYLLMLAAEGQPLAYDTSENTAAMLKTVVKGILDVTGVTEKVSKKLAEPLKKIKKITGDKVKDLGGKAVDKITPEAAKKLVKKLKRLAYHYCQKSFDKMRLLLIQHIPDLPPKVLDNVWIKYIRRKLVFMGDIRHYIDKGAKKGTEYLKGKAKDRIKKKAKEEGTLKTCKDKYDQVKKDTIEDLEGMTGLDRKFEDMNVDAILRDIFFYFYKQQTAKALNQVPQRIREKAFIPALIDTDIEEARLRYVDFAQAYLDQHEKTREIAEFKAAVDLIKEIGTGTYEYTQLVFAGPAAYKAAKKLVMVIDAAYSKVNLVLGDMPQLYRWLKVYAKNLKMFRAASDDILQTRYLSVKKDIQLQGMDMAFAANSSYDIDHLQRMYENGIEGDHPDRELVFKYSESQIDRDFYEELADIMGLVSEGLPEDEEARQLAKEYDSKFQKADRFIQENENKVKNLKILKKKRDPIVVRKITFPIFWSIIFLVILFNIKKWLRAIKAFVDRIKQNIRSRTEDIKRRKQERVEKIKAAREHVKDEIKNVSRTSIEAVRKWKAPEIVKIVVEKVVCFAGQLWVLIRRIPYKKIFAAIIAGLSVLISMIKKKGVEEKEKLAEKKKQLEEEKTLAQQKPAEVARQVMQPEQSPVQQEQQTQQEQQAQKVEAKPREVSQVKKIYHPSKFSVIEPIKFGFGMFFKKFFFLLLWVYIVMGICGGVLFLAGDVIFNFSPVLEIVSIIVFFGGLLCLLIGFFKILIKLGAQEKARVSYLFTGSFKFFDVLFGLIFYLVVVAFGTVFFVIPGIIFALRGQMFFIFILKDNRSPIAALKESFRVTKGSAWKLFKLSFMLILINAAGALPVFLGWLITIPASIIALSYAAQKLQHEEMTDEEKDFVTGAMA